jgi:hypothetical protein
MTLRSRSARRLRLLLALAPVLVPLALLAHSHAASQLGTHRPCELCCAANHGAVADFGPKVLLAPIPSCGTTPALPLRPPIEVSVPRPNGRAPPASPSCA